jgi:O-antigen/teichoic acid export membrane protein
MLSQPLRFVARSTASLYATTIVTSLLGFGYWSLAAHRLPPAQVGYASAIVSVMQLLAMLCVLGLNTLIISEVSARPYETATLVATSGAVALTSGAVGAIVTALILRSASATYMAIFASTWAVPIFVVGVAVSTLTLVVDDACVAARRPSLQLSRNAIFAALKLALIPLAVLVLPRTNGIQLLATWVVATVLSLWAVRGLLRYPPGRSARSLLDLSLIISRGQLALRHHWLNVSVQAPRYAIVAIAAVIVGPRLTAAFYAALLIVGFVTIIPGLLTMVLFALTPGDERALREHVRFTLGISALLALVAAPTFYLLSGFALSLFSNADLVARPAMWVLGLSVAPFAVKSHYVVVARVRGQMGKAARFTTVGAALEVAAACFGGWHAGLTGMAITWLIAACLEALVFAPTVYRAAVSKSKDPSSLDEG